MINGQQEFRGTIQLDDSCVALVKELIARPSITPEDGGCQKYVAELLSPAGFKAKHMRFGDVDNLWLRRQLVPPLFVFLGHTDVVPPGPLAQWKSDPFVPVERDGLLYGRGAADMKTSIAAFCVAASTFVADFPKHRGSIALLLTSDEEGPAIDGTRKVVDALTEQGQNIDFCLVGEPTSESNLGDVIKIGRRGSLSGELTVHGVQGHVAYPHLAENPVHTALSALSKLANTKWDAGDSNFPATTFQITSVQTGTHVSNVIPGDLSVKFNFRFSTASTAEGLKHMVEKILQENELRYTLNWTVSGLPFLTRDHGLIDAVTEAIYHTLGITPTTSTTGGTSDGRFVAPTGAQVVELGPVNATIHKVNECVTLDTPRRLSDVYYRILVSILT